MEKEKLKSIAKEAEDAVSDIEDESLRKIAFDKILERLLAQSEVASSNILQQQNLTSSPAMLQINSNNLTELVAQKNPRSNTDIVITIAFYYHYNQGGSFNVEEVISEYKNLLIPVPANPTDIINQNIRKGFISKQGQKNSKQAYQITKLGLDYVNNNFIGKSRMSNKKKRKGNK